VKIPRLISPLTNPAGYLAAASALLAVAVMLDNVISGHGVINPTVIVGAIGAVSALLVRHVVTPVSDPKAADGTPLVPTVPVPAPVAVTTTMPYGWPLPAPGPVSAAPVIPVSPTAVTPPTGTPVIKIVPPEKGQQS
jgi:hypothetical protein